jgi:hypothetical protein
MAKKTQFTAEDLQFACLAANSKSAGGFQCGLLDYGMTLSGFSFKSRSGRFSSLHRARHSAEPANIPELARKLLASRPGCEFPH